MSDQVEVFCQIVRVTGAAVLVEDGQQDKEGNAVRHWLPLSQLDYAGDLEEGAHTELSMPEWLAAEKEMI